jgi:hypothetical protein
MGFSGARGEFNLISPIAIYANIADCHANVAYLARTEAEGVSQVISRLYLACRRTRLWPMPVRAACWRVGSPYSNITETAL